MFHFNFWEILLTVVIALLVLGPKQLPGLAEMLGKSVARFQNLKQQLQDSLTQQDDENKPK